MDRLEEQIKAMIVDRLMLKIRDEDDLLKTYDIDSPKLFEIVIGIEEHFGIQLADEEFSRQRFSTVKGIAAVIRPKLLTK